MKKTVKKILSLLLVLIISIGASIVVFAEETNDKSYEFDEKTGELRLYNDAWDKDLITDLNIDENDVIESSIEVNFPRAEYEFLLKVKSIFIDEKIKISDRDSWPVVLDATDKIVWIPGLKKSKLDKKITEEYDIVMKYY